MQNQAVESLVRECLVPGAGGGGGGVIERERNSVVVVRCEEGRKAFMALGNHYLIKTAAFNCHEGIIALEYSRKYFQSLLPSQITNAL